MNSSKTISTLLLMSLTIWINANAFCAENYPLGVMKVTYGRSIDDLPLYVGLEEGFWEKEGLKVELVRLAGEQNIIAAALHGDIDAGHLGPPSFFHAVIRKIPVKIVAWLGRAHTGTRCGLHADQKSDIKNISDLKGKRIATSGDISARMILRETLIKAGLTFDDIHEIKGIKLDEAMKHEAALRSQGVDVISA
ncbi:NMT1/THI5 like domain protein [uncultured Desulfobacterium sp.]|uniref:NMT1/THI5 like domain protein n=2 Tax=uncultured Desulfobacterium sp. TaxID=201089 RepID=A0A445N154_9BACT|nr:NMT1/THI5 like domain protein [uncultured Desulfobacterium sp.]